MFLKVLFIKVSYLLQCSAWLRAVAAQESATNLLSREDWRGTRRTGNNYRVTPSSIWIRAFRRAGWLSGLPLVHRVYFIVYARVSHAQSFWCSRLLARWMTEERIGDVGGNERARESERKRERNWGRRVIRKNECYEHGTPRFAPLFFFLSLRTRKIFFAFELAPLSHSSRILLFFLSSLLSIQSSFRVNHGRALFDLFNFRNCYFVKRTLALSIVVEANISKFSTVTRDFITGIKWHLLF